MATSAWRVFRVAKLKMLDGTIDLDTHLFRMHLYVSGSNITDLGHSARGSITNELTGHANYTQSGLTMTGQTLALSGSTLKWDISDFVLTASGTAWTDVKHALIATSDGIPVCYSELSSAGFNVADGNSLTITMNTSGIFELTGGET